MKAAVMRNGKLLYARTDAGMENYGTMKVDLKVMAGAPTVFNVTHRAGVALAVVLVLASSLSFAQTSPLVGTWERVSALTAAGTPETPLAPAMLIVSSDGHFIFSAIPAGRPKVNKPLEQMIREELLERFKGLTVRQGTWMVTGNRFINIEIGAENPNLEGREVVRLFKIDGDMLIVSSPNPQDKTENRWKRVTSNSR